MRITGDPDNKHCLLGGSHFKHAMDYIHIFAGCYLDSSN